VTPISLIGSGPSTVVYSVNANPNLSARTGYPVWVGEFGAFEAVPQDDRVRYTRTIRDEIERRGMTWAYWELAGGFGFIDPATAQGRPNGIEQALFGH